MKKILLSVIGVVLVVLAGVYVYVATIDWNQHKDKIAEQFSIVLNKEVAFDGPLSFKLLPSPYLSASDIKIYNPTNRDVPLAKVKRLVASLKLFPLLGGDFEVERMSVEEPEINFSVLEDGSINWQGQQNLDAEYKESDIQVSLDSVTIEKATVKFLYPKRGLDFDLENLNAEVIAESINGPYRIEGSYIKDNNPEGFAVSLGQFSQTFETPVNLVVNQPAFETYLRFDGSVFFKNDVVKGNVIFESNKLVEFINRNFKQYNLASEYNYPLTVSLELITSSSRIDFSNVVMKYGSTTGAGNVSVPLVAEKAYEPETGDEIIKRRRVEAGFNMTEVDLAPLSHLFKETVSAYEDKDFSPDLGFDLVGDVRAVKAGYNGHQARNVALSFDVLKEEVKVNSFAALLPGDGDWKAKGNIFSMDGALSYSFENSLGANDFAQTLSFFGCQLPNLSEFTYKKATGNWVVSGNLKNVKLSPFDFTLDKTVLGGELGFIVGERLNILFLLNADSINFDNYAASLPPAEKQKDFASKMAYRFSNLAWVNGFDARGTIKLGLGIYENIPFENTSLDFNLKDGVLGIEDLKIGSMANAMVEAKGNVKGFGTAVSFENLRYGIDTSDFSSFLNKLEIPMPNVNLKDIKNFSSKGIATGDLTRVAIKSVSKLGAVDYVFNGEAASQENKLYLNGELEVRAPDFVRMINDFNFGYSPNAFSLGIFALKTNFTGSLDKFKATSVNANIGANNFQGAVVFDGSGQRNNIAANIVCNKFEFDRFFYNPAGVKQDVKSTFKPLMAESAEFLARPFFEKDKLVFDFYNLFDLKAKISCANLSYKGTVFEKAELDLSLQNGLAKMENFTAEMDGGKIRALVEATLGSEPKLKGSFETTGQSIKGGSSWGGSRYGLTSGVLNAKAQFETNFASIDDVVGNMVATVDFDIKNPTVKGWDLDELYVDLKNRNKTEGLAALAYDVLQKGQSSFDSFDGKLSLNRGSYTFENAKFAAENVVLLTEASGSLTVWDMNSKFKLKFLDLEKVPEMEFGFVGLMASPKLNVDVTKITDTYDGYWARVETEKKNEELARLEALNNSMAEQQQEAILLRDKIQKEVLVDLDEKKAKASNEEILSEYEKIRQNLVSADESIEDIFAQAMVKDFDDAFIKELDKKNTDITQRVDKGIAEVAAVYLKDVKGRINNDYNNIADNYESSKVKVAQYRDKFGEFNGRLARVNTMINLDIDPDVRKYKDAIEKDLLDLDALNYAARQEYVVIQSNVDIAQLEEYAVNIRGASERSDEDMIDLDTSIRDLLDYVERMVSAEEIMFNEKKKEQETLQKIEENTGKISTGSGKSITVKRDIEEIEKAEEALEKSDVKVLDFSKPTTEVKKEGVVVNKKPTVEESAKIKMESQTGFVREIGDEPIKAGGVIKKD